MVNIPPVVSDSEHEEYEECDESEELALWRKLEKEWNTFPGDSRMIQKYANMIREKALRLAANTASNACFALNMPNCGAAAAVSKSSILKLI